MELALRDGSFPSLQRRDTWLRQSCGCRQTWICHRPKNWWQPLWVEAPEAGWTGKKDREAPVADGWHWQWGLLPLWLHPLGRVMEIVNLWGDLSLWTLAKNQRVIVNLCRFVASLLFLLGIVALLFTVFSTQDWRVLSSPFARPKKEKQGSDDNHPAADSKKHPD
jgi:hypothetical protein